MIKRGLTVILALAAMVAAAADAFAQEAAANPPPSAPDAVTITGTRTEDAIRDFVGQVAIASRSEDQLARWDSRICPGVAGLKAPYGQFLLDRIARRASELGLGVGKPGCTPDVVILASPDPDAAARDLFETSKRDLGYYQERGHETLGRDALKQFLASDAPVRWWFVNRTVSDDGRVAADSILGDAPVLKLPGRSSLIRRMTHQDFAIAFIIIDARRLPSVRFPALADYVAMVSLAQLDPRADTAGRPTILNLFASAADEAPGGLTAWDLAFLRGLYAADREAVSARRQQSQIVNSMHASIAPD